MRHGAPRRWAIAIAATVVLALTAAPASAATISVSTTADTVANDGLCSMREALTSAATDTASGAASGECPAGAGADRVVLGARDYTLSRPGSGEDANATGDLDVTAGNVTIEGAGRGTTTIDAGGIDRALDVLGGATATVEHLTITGGRAPAGAGGILGDPGGPGGPGSPGGDSTGGAGAAGSNGGGIRNAGTLNLEDVELLENHAGAGGAGGGAVLGGNGGNNAGGNGGAGGRSTGGTGGAGGAGGGLFSSAGTVTVSDSVFSGNLGGGGGAGGPALHGGNGGEAGGNGTGGGGGACSAGSGGAGGGGGAIAIVGGEAEVIRSAIEANSAGSGAPGATCDASGNGGAGAGSGNGGNGAFLFDGTGGSGGSGGGVLDVGAKMTISDSTIAANHAGAAGSGGSGGTAGSGGNGGAGTGSGGAGGFNDAGSGGEGGLGGGVTFFSGGAAAMKLHGDTLSGNAAGAGGAGGAGGQGGNGGGNGGGGGGAGGASTSFGGSGGEGGEGGALYLDAYSSVVEVTITGNAGAVGGAGGAGGTGPAESSGGSGGEGGFGGGILVSGIGVLSHVTALSNSTAPGGAGGGGGTGSPAVTGSTGSPGTGGDLTSFGFGSLNTTLSASIVASCSGEIADGGGDITPSVGGCPGAVADPGLGPLANNGGPTRTMALHPGSPAVDAVKPPCGTEPDQRGVSRPQGAGCDAGAYELAPPTITTGKPSRAGRKGITVNGQIDPNARATAWHVDYGTSKAYGLRTADQTLPAGIGPVAVSASLTGLKPGKAVHYRLVATNADGTTAGPDATLNPAAKFAGVKILTGSARVGSDGRVAVRLACAKGAGGGCAGSISIRAKAGGKKQRLRRKPAKGQQLAHAAFKLSAGAQKAVKLQLAGPALAMIDRAGPRGLAVTAVANARDGSGRRATTTHPLRLKPPR